VLALIRFATSLGLGAIMPNAIALMAEYSPRHLRSRLIAAVATAPLVGGTLCGLVSGPLIRTHGWEGIFWTGGIIGLLMLPIAALLPESVSFSIVVGKSDTQIAALLGRIYPTIYREGPFRSPSKLASGMALRQLFCEGLAAQTMLLWTAVACNLFMSLLMVYWLPLLLTGQGLPPSLALLATATFNGAGIVGGLVLGTFAARCGVAALLVVTSLAASASIALVGLGGSNSMAIIPSLFIAGFFCLGSYACFSVLAVSIYPVSIRSAGLGWALSIGKAGAALSPLAAAAALSANLGAAAIFGMAALGGGVSALATLLIARSRRADA
jgi:AAHS family 4-hydroxybenzoate transporter-like MFS transporter